ncbi:P63C domain-containing protein [Morganella morganii]
MTDSKKEKVTGKAVGGKARAAKMTAAERTESAKKAAAAKKAKALLPTTINEGKLKIGDVEMDVAVLEDGKRIISQSSVFKALGRPTRGVRTAKLVPSDGVINMPAFMDAGNLKPYIGQDLIDAINKVQYKSILGVVQEGYDASILPLVCDVYLKARESGAITRPNQLDTAKKAEILVRSLAKVGIIALVDEATGYQRDREKNALAKILEAFVAKEIQPYITTFPADYYEELFRLRGLEYPPENPRFRPQYFGVLTNDIVYKRLAPNILEELKKQNNKSAKGTKLFQNLTPNIGYQKLREHLSSTVTVMKLSNDYKDFIEKMNRLHPRFASVAQAELDESDK